MTAAGDVEGMIGVATDITIQHEADEKLREQEDLMRELLRNIPEAFFIVASDFSRTVFLSPAFEAIWGIPVAEAYSDPLIWSKSLFSDDREKVFSQLKEVVEKGRVFSEGEMSYRITRRDGSIRWVESRTFPIRNAAGKVVNIAGVARDITEDRMQQEDMARLAAIVQTSPNAIFRKTLEGIIATWNPGAERMYGYTQAEAVGRSVKMLAPPELHEEIDRIMAEIRAGRQVVNLETERVRKDGTRFPVVITVAPIRDEKGEIEAASTVAQDITLEKRAEARVRELDALRNKFIQIVAHQLRTPLNAISWNIEALLGGELGKLRKEQQDFLHISYEANREVIGRIRDLLTAMDIEEGRLILNPEEVSIETIWNTVAVEWKKRCAVKDLVCDYAPPKKPLPSMFGDGEKIHDVMDKIMENAITYTPPKGKLAAKLEKIDHSIRFSMTDNGIGIPVAEQPRVFSRFFRASNASAMKTDASGLGMYISKHFIEQHGGRIGFESKEGGGSTFWFELPLKPKKALS